MKGRGICPDVAVYSSLMHYLCSMDEREDKDMLCKPMKMEEGLFVSVVNKGRKRNVVSYNSLINGYCKNRKLRLHDLVPNLTTYNVYLDGLCKNNCFSEAVGLFHSLENCKFESSIEILNCLINCLCKIGKLATAWDLFYRMPNKGLKPAVVTYAIMIHGLCTEGQMERAKDLLVELEDKSCTPNVVRSPLIHSCWFLPK
ncbi:hypothetical protein POTOM_021917 [Populus tomentosa]|uniref:Pentatricopeptide repeat-containing protein n=1 Tax=Populus tomentosa TaxID=118781 RepID=A0A8X8D1U8_POPTO|nr:hypothetical protein POTOM_021917 [Populus tomentosa]